MVNTRERALDHGWVVICYFLLAGGITASLIAFMLIDADYDGVEYGVFGLGAVLGSFCAGRLCPRKRLNEPGTAAVAVVLSMVAALTTTTFGPQLWDEPTLVIAKRACLLGAVSLVGALLGAHLGHRTSKASAPSLWGWASVSILMSFGTFAAVILLIFGVFLRDSFAGDNEPVGGALVALFVAMGLATAGAGLLTQILSSRRIPWVAGVGGTVVLMALAIIGVVTDGEDEDIIALFFGMLVICGVWWSVGYAGSRVGWWLRQRAAAQVSVPEAQVIDD